MKALILCVLFSFTALGSHALSLDGNAGAAAVDRSTRIVTTVIEDRQGDQLRTRAGDVQLNGVVEIDRRLDRGQWQGANVHLTYRRGELVRATFF